MTDEPVAPAAAPDEECWTKIEGAQSEAPGGKATAYRPRIHDAVRALMLVIIGWTKGHARNCA